MIDGKKMNSLCVLGALRGARRMQNPVLFTGTAILLAGVLVGVLAAGLEAGLGLAEALPRASVAAALCCTRPGAQTSLPVADEIAARLGDLAPMRTLE